MTKRINIKDSASLFIALGLVILSGNFQQAKAEVGFHYQGCISHRTPGCTDPGVALPVGSLLIPSPRNSQVSILGGPSTVSLSISSGGDFEPMGCLSSIPLTGCLTSSINSIAGASGIYSPDGKKIYRAGRFVALSYLDSTQSGPPKFGGCIAAKAAFGCRPDRTRSLVGVGPTTVSSDGKSVYAAVNSGVAEFRQPERGPLRLSGCVSQKRKAGCTFARTDALSFGRGLEVVPNGAFGYMSSLFSISSFKRRKNGALRYAGCVGISGQGCKTLKRGSFDSMGNMQVSKDGKRLFAVSTEPGVIFQFRIGEDGRLSLAGCLAYRGRFGCARAPGDHLHRPSIIRLGPFGDLFVGLTAGGVERYRLGRAGTLRLSGCIDERVASSCEHVDVPGDLALNAVSPDGRFLYFGSDGEFSIFRKTLGDEANMFGSVGSGDLGLEEA